MTRRKLRIAILGGGFGGIACASDLASKHFDVTLVDRRDSFEFLPNIHELLSGTKTAQSLKLPLDSMLTAAGHRFLCAEVARIDVEARMLEFTDGDALEWDYLVVAIGGVDATFGVTGVERNALPFKSVAQCARIGRALAALEEGSDNDGNREVIVVGGGLEGIEALGEILRRYRHSAISTTLVEARPRLLPEAPAALDGYLRALCAELPVNFRCGTPVRRINKREVVLTDGIRLPSDLTIWTGGPAPPPLLAASDLADKGAWATVDASLRSSRSRHVFVVGDSAALPWDQVRQAYHALDMGRCAAGNLHRLARGRSPLRYRPSNKPMLVAFGDLSCMLVAGRLAVAGPALSTGKEAVYELVMAQYDRRPMPRRIAAMLARGQRAGRELVWPTLRSVEALRRQGQLTLLSAD